MVQSDLIKMVIVIKWMHLQYHMNSICKINIINIHFIQKVFKMIVIKTLNFRLQTKHISFRKRFGTPAFVFSVELAPMYGQFILPLSRVSINVWRETNTFVQYFFIVTWLHTLMLTILTWYFFYLFSF